MEIKGKRCQNTCAGNDVVKSPRSPVTTLVRGERKEGYLFLRFSFDVGSLQVPYNGVASVTEICSARFR
jgi:hypothetical protein